MAAATPLDDFKSVLSGTARALTGVAEVEVSFTADAPHAAGTALKVSSPPRALPREQVAVARGQADMLALRLKHHDTGLHARMRPADTAAAAVFDAVEQARTASLGARRMQGLRDNLTAETTARLGSDPITRAMSASDVPMATAVELMAREYLGGMRAPVECERGLDMVRGDIDAKAGADFEALSLLIDDQRAFAEQATRMLEHLDLLSPATPQDATEADDDGADQQDQPDDSDSDSDNQDSGGAAEADARMERREVTVGGEANGMTRLVSGVKAGDLVVTEGAFAVKATFSRGKMPAGG